MAVVNIKSTLVSNADSSPVILNNPYVALGLDRFQTAVVAIGSTDTAASTYRLCKIASSANISDIQIQNDALTTGTSYKCGVLFQAVDGGAVVVAASDQICFSAVSMVAARNVWTSLYFPAILGAAGLVANQTLRIWELLGLTVDPFKVYDLVISGVTVSTVGGNIAARVAYAQ